MLRKEPLLPETTEKPKNCQDVAPIDTGRTIENGIVTGMLFKTFKNNSEYIRKRVLGIGDHLL